MAARAALALEGGGGSGVPAHELNIGQKYVTGRFVGGGGSHARWLCLLWVTRVSPTEICFARDGSLARIGGGDGADSCRFTGSSANSRSRAATPGGSASPAEVVARRAARQAAAEKREAEEKQRRAQKEAAAVVVAAAPTAVEPRASPKRRRHLAGLAALAASLQSNQQHSTS